mmetsp:Transcript_23078/g.58834  ORF Transcript_23078/g.58834 Transcript_23078/m.58834 type:complete len:246 (-) Transcript_23078:613-1350(-)
MPGRHALPPEFTRVVGRAALHGTSTWQAPSANPLLVGAADWHKVSEGFGNPSGGIRYTGRWVRSVASQPQSQRFHWTSIGRLATRSHGTFNAPAACPLTAQRLPYTHLSSCSVGHVVMELVRIGPQPMKSTVRRPGGPQARLLAVPSEFKIGSRAKQCVPVLLHLLLFHEPQPLVQQRDRPRIDLPYSRFEQAKDQSDAGAPGVTLSQQGFAQAAGITHAHKSELFLTFGTACAACIVQITDANL